MAGRTKTTAELGTANGDGENVYEMNNYEGTGSEPSPHGMAEDGEPMDMLIPTMRARCGVWCAHQEDQLQIPAGYSALAR